MRAESFVDLWRVALNPSENCGMVYTQSTLSHHLFDIPVRKLVAAVPANAEEDERRLEVTPLERGFIQLHEDDSGRVMDELGSGL